MGLEAETVGNPRSKHPRSKHPIKSIMATVSPPEVGTCYPLTTQWYAGEALCPINWLMWHVAYKPHAKERVCDEGPTKRAEAGIKLCSFVSFMCCIR